MGFLYILRGFLDKCRDGCHWAGYIRTPDGRDSVAVNPAGEIVPLSDFETVSNDQAAAARARQHL